jgi:hypothetical protein
MSEQETHPILCGVCNVPVKQGTDAQGNATAVCPSCGISDSAENATREASEYILDKLMREGLPESNGPGMTVTHPPKRSFRFIVGD